MGTHPIFESDFDCLTVRCAMSCSVVAGAIMAYVTCPSVQVAKSIAHVAVKSKLAACGNIIPSVISVYEWKGVVEEEAEVSLILKSQSPLSESLIKLVKENHPAEVPCVLVLPVQSGNPDSFPGSKNKLSPKKTRL